MDAARMPTRLVWCELKLFSQVQPDAGAGVHIKCAAAQVSCICVCVPGSNACQHSSAAFRNFLTPNVLWWWQEGCAAVFDAQVKDTLEPHMPETDAAAPYTLLTPTGSSNCSAPQADGWPHHRQVLP